MGCNTTLVRFLSRPCRGSFEMTLFIFFASLFNLLSFAGPKERRKEKDLEGFRRFLTEVKTADGAYRYMLSVRLREPHFRLRRGYR